MTAQNLEQTAFCQTGKSCIGDNNMIMDGNTENFSCFHELTGYCQIFLTRLGIAARVIV